jgi:hypothetical protein
MRGIGLQLFFLGVWLVVGCAADRATCMGKPCGGPPGLPCRCGLPADAGSSSAGEPTASSGARVDCGSSWNGGEMPCCLEAWVPGGHCDPDGAEQSCWGACTGSVTDEDGGMTHVTGQLSCGNDGIVYAGLGLFSCTP